ncbi:MAG: hypothetical protein L6R45_31790 [Anaerolineae bacterium]|nr:hypothetical protein [Anaerolineae bacterium]
MADQSAQVNKVLLRRRAFREVGIAPSGVIYPRRWPPKFRRLVLLEFATESPQPRASFTPSFHPFVVESYTFIIQVSNF